MVTRTEFAKVIVGLLLSIASCFQIHKAALAISNVYNSLHATLPVYKQFLITYHPLIYFVPVFILTAWLVPKWRGRAGTFTLATGITLFLCLILFLAVLSSPLTPRLTAA